MVYIVTTKAPGGGVNIWMVCESRAAADHTINRWEPVYGDIFMVDVWAVK